MSSPCRPVVKLSHIPLLCLQLREESREAAAVWRIFKQVIMSLRYKHCMRESSEGYCIHFDFCWDRFCF